MPSTMRNAGVRALPLAQEISREGQVSYFLQPTGCGGQVIEARVQDYLLPLPTSPPARPLDVRWALTCMELEDEVERLEAVLSPVLLRRAQAKLCRHCITTTTTHSPGCPSWKPTCTV